MDNDNLDESWTQIKQQNGCSCLLLNRASKTFILNGYLTVTEVSPPAQDGLLKSILSSMSLQGF